MAEFDPATSAAMLAQLDAYHTQVGRVAAAWATLDLVVDGLIWKLIEIKPLLGAAITSEIPSVHTKCRCLVVILQLLDGGNAFVRKINRFNEELRPLIENRNRLIHDAWAVADNAEEISQITKAITGKEITVGFTAAEFENLEQHNRQVWNKIRAIIAINSDVEDWLVPSPRKWLRPLDGITIGP